MIYKGVELYNVEALLPCATACELAMSRVPDHLRLRLNEGAQRTALNGSGVELRFNLVGESVTITLRRAADEGIPSIGIGEVWYGDFPAPYGKTPVLIYDKPTAITINKPENLERLIRVSRESKSSFDPSLVRLRLPYDYQNRLVSIEGNVTPPYPSQVPTRKFLAYGSSITHGGDAVRPSGGYIMRTAQYLDRDVINLGFAGSAHLEPEMADYVAARDDWEFATLELGINVIGPWSTGQFAERVNDFITRIAGNNPDKWVFCTDIFTCSMDFSRDAKVEEFRSIVRSQVENMKLPKLRYISGRELLTSANGLTADLVHPSATGAEEIALNLSTFIRKHLSQSD